MGKKVWFRAFVERLLMAQFDTRELVVDVDGDVPFHDETAACWVSIETRPAQASRPTGSARRQRHCARSTTSTSGRAWQRSRSARAGSSSRCGCRPTR